MTKKTYTQKEVEDTRYNHLFTGLMIGAFICFFISFFLMESGSDIIDKSVLNDVCNIMFKDKFNRTFVYEEENIGVSFVFICVENKTDVIVPEEIEPKVIARLK